MAAGAARIRVTFTVDADGLLNVAALEQVSGVEARIDVKPSYGLGDDQIAQMLKDSFSTAESDMRARAVVEARVDGDRLLMATQTALDADGDLMGEQERADIHTAVQTLRSVLSCDDAALIESTSKALAQATESFAAKRMNRGIAHALAGKNIATL
jgi:molecular chaperone HscA